MGRMHLQTFGRMYVAGLECVLGVALEVRPDGGAREDGRVAGDADGGIVGNAYCEVRCEAAPQCVGADDIERVGVGLGGTPDSRALVAAHQVPSSTI